jgi:hypothetical protein
MPNVGDTTTKYNTQKYIWLECDNCHIGRWVQLCKTKRNYFTNLCFSCHNIGRIPPRQLPSGKPRKPHKNLSPEMARKYYLKCKDSPQYKTRRKAHDILKYHVGAGHITPQVCVICGNPKGEGHHTDYSKPLLVTWLCHSCHIKVHWGIINLPELSPAPIPREIK